MSRSERSADDIAAASAISLAELPLIDFAPFLSGDAAARRRVAAEIAHACEEIGFFYLAGHGVPQATVDGIFGQADAFFSRDKADRHTAMATPDWYRGWIPAPEAQPLSRNTRMFEQYRLQHEWPANPRDMRHADIFDKPNRWPDDMPAFKQASEDYLAAMLTFSRELLRAFALGLGVAEDRFDDCFHQPASQLSMNYYPQLPMDAQDEVSNMVAHTDEGPFTVLAQQDVGGLEVKRRDGVWIQAPPVHGAFTINVGDMMMWWSNGRFLSNYHRVRNRDGARRFSVPYFANPDREVVVAPLPELLAGAEPKYKPVRVADHLARFYSTLSKNPHDIYN
ncbi:isopenicillin N synthase family dioxygenase [Nitrospirillum sp. BR 11163]|uniref:isopenicillin N synthase family dioxygenase n=1 Tax=Nitrospirillum sp. BR 11163 TaxID=3104323 RepID=UPI002AFEED8D|nr:2OG-Fe(II) oxygenase family protein [Nitrospirillum sp. BR 11163]MEA1675970.1 2-oxoglutarate and iron-dependent oxygenase domain-containing protein [Nitrospirillum sp. BR 11163]